MSPDLPPPRVGLGLLKRALIAGVVIVLATASAVSATVLLEVDSLRDEFLGEGRQQIDIPEVTRAEAGEPRTFLLLGSDARWEDEQLGRDPRSDTILLARVDPDADSIALMSVPRDLRHTFPNGTTDKINSAYARGGARGVVRAIKRTFGEAGESFPIHHVINIDFGAFRRAINYIGGVYVDVDRDYFNDNAPPRNEPSGQPYATIDVSPGYQLLKGRDALDYVRYRHGDNDLVRAARQQDFIRQLKDTSGLQQLLDLGDRHRLARVFGRYLQVDRSLRSTQEIFALARLAIYIQDKPVREVPFRVSGESLSYVEASDADLRRTAQSFLSTRESVQPPTEAGDGAESSSERSSSASSRRERRRRREREQAIPSGMERADRSEGELRAIAAGRRLPFPFYFPTIRANGADYDGETARVYKVQDELGKRHKAYRLVIAKNRATGEYYGVQGTAWRDPPILDNPTRTIRRGGRTLRLYYDGRDIRVVAWRTPRAVYWVSNTLTRQLNSKQMIALAVSLKRLGQR